VELVEADDARRYQAVPVDVRDGVLIIALADPMAMQTMDDLTYKLGRELEFRLRHARCHSKADLQIPWGCRGCYIEGFAEIHVRS
jgi:hypothetical protein